MVKVVDACRIWQKEPLILPTVASRGLIKRTALRSHYGWVGVPSWESGKVFHLEAAWRGEAQSCRTAWNAWRYSGALRPKTLFERLHQSGSQQETDGTFKSEVSWRLFTVRLSTKLLAWCSGTKEWMLYKLGLVTEQLSPTLDLKQQGRELELTKERRMGESLPWEDREL